MGVKGLYNLNRALLRKWFWRFANETKSLWRKVISSKYGEDSGGCCSCKVRGPYGTGVWKEIRKEWESFFPNTMCSAGNGRMVRLWKDFWCGEQPSSITFPSWFSMAVNKEALVVDLWNPDGEEGGWSPHFSRYFNDWELEEVPLFLHVIQQKSHL